MSSFLALSLSILHQLRGLFENTQAAHSLCTWEAFALDSFLNSVGASRRVTGPFRGTPVISNAFQIVGGGVFLWESQASATVG